MSVLRKHYTKNTIHMKILFVIKNIVFTIVPIPIFATTELPSVSLA